MQPETVLTTERNTGASINLKVLLTGGAGYLGSTLARHLLERGHYVRVLDKLIFGDQSLKELAGNPNFELHKGDIRHVEDVTSAMKDIDAVIDLAAIVGVPACEKNGDASTETNYWATKLLAQVAVSNGIRRFLFASTCSVYGEMEDVIVTESSPTKPLSVYAETKLLSEQALLGTEGGLEPVVMRLSTLCGPSFRMRFDLVLNVMTATAHFNHEVKVFGGNQWRPLLDVRDAARAFSTLLEADADQVSHSVFNVGSNDHNIVIKDLAELVVKQVGDAKLTFGPSREDSRSYRVDFSKIHRMGFDTRLSFARSIRDVRKLFLDRIVTDYNDTKYNNSGWVIAPMPTRPV